MDATEWDDDWPTRQEPTPFPLPAGLLVPVAMLLGGGLGIPVVLDLPLVPEVLARSALPYAVIASVVAVVLRLRARRCLDGKSADDRLTQERSASQLMEGRSASQRTTRVAAMWLLAIWLLTAVLFAMQRESVVLIVCGPVLVGAFISIVANAKLIFSPRTALAEVRAVHSRSSGRRRILTTWILAPLAWFAYAIPAQLYLLSVA